MSGLSTRSFSDVPLSLMHMLLGTRTKFSRFLRSCMEPAKSLVKSGGDLFPCAPPFPWQVSSVSVRSRRQQCRFAKRRAVEVITNLQVVALNYLALHEPAVCGIGGKTGNSLSPSQWAMVSHLVHTNKSMCRLSDKSEGCGLRIPIARDRLSALKSYANSLSEVLAVPYSSNRPRMDFDLKNDLTAGATMRPVIASRVAFPKETSDFHPEAFLCKRSRAAYVDPSTILLPYDQRPPHVKTRGTATLDELVLLLWLWDRVGRLGLVREFEVDGSDEAPVFCVAKDEDQDRQIINRKARNAKELLLPTPAMPHPSLICQMFLLSTQVLLMSIDDLAHFYHSFVVTSERALSNVVGPVFRAAEWIGSKAHGGKFGPCERVRTLFHGLPMGDKNAVTFAQESHSNVIKAAGGQLDSEVLIYGKPLPLAPRGFYEGLMVDDRLGLMKFDRSNWRARSAIEQGPDLETFTAANVLYAKVGLEAHSAKAKRREAVLKGWGAEIEGDVGLVGAPRNKLSVLMQLTMDVACFSVADFWLVQSLLGSWAFIFQFRRVLFSLFGEIYRVGPPEGGDESTPLRLPHDARVELQLAAILAPLSISDIRTPVDPFVYSCDASPLAAGACKAFVGSDVAAELWRRGDVQGKRICLLNPASAVLKASGYEIDEDSGDDFSDLPGDASMGARSLAHDSPATFKEEEEDKLCLPLWQQALWQTLLRAYALTGIAKPSFDRFPLCFEFLELYSGCSEMSRKMAKSGLKVGPPIDLALGADLSSGTLFRWLVFMCEKGRILFLFWAPPCTTYSIAQHPACRSSDCPQGLNPLDIDTLFGTLHMLQCLWLSFLQISVGHYFCGEQPASGYAKLLVWWKLLEEFCLSSLLDQCCFNRPYLKTTLLIHNLPCLATPLVERRCQCTQLHVRLEGSLTSAASAYPPLLCQVIAEAVVGSLGAERKRFSQKLETAPFFEATPPEDPAPRKKHRINSHLWALQLSECLPWKTCVQYRFTTPGHINILEAKARRTLIKRIGRDARPVILHDSKVLLGASGKGRSGSPALNAILRNEAAWILGKNLYPSGVHASTWCLRGDDPSRFKAVRPPTIAFPTWFWTLKRAGAVAAQADLDEASFCSRPVARWFQFGSHVLTIVRFNLPFIPTPEHLPEALESRKGYRDSGCCSQPRFDSTAAGKTSSTVHHVVRGKERPGISCGIRDNACISSAGVGLVWSPSFYRRCLEIQSYGNDQFSKSAVSLVKGESGWSLGHSQCLGAAGSHDSSSTDSEALVRCLRHHCPSLELDIDRFSYAGSLPRIIETVRLLAIGLRRHYSAHIASDRKSPPSIPEARKDALQGCSSSVRPSGRKLRRSFCHSFTQEHLPLRAHLDSLLSNVAPPIETTFDRSLRSAELDFAVVLQTGRCHILLSDVE